MLQMLTLAMLVIGTVKGFDDNPAKLNYAPEKCRINQGGNMLSLIFFMVIFAVGIVAGMACFVFFSNSAAELSSENELHE